MKRLMILVAMMAFVLLLPMNAEAANDLIIDLDDYTTYTLTENMTVDNLEVYSKLDLNGYKLEVKGDVIAEANVRISSGTLIVAGDYIQKAEYLVINGGNLTVNGDFRVQDINENGEYVSSRGGFYGSYYDGGTITVEGDTYIDVVHHDGCGMPTGTFVAKGDFIVENAYAFGEANKMVALEIAGKSKQKLSLVNDMYINNLVFTNQNVEISGIINAKLGSDATKITLDDGICEVSFLDLNGYDMVIPGTVHAYGTVEVRDGNLTVNKDYVQTKPCLNVSTGKVIVKENLRLQGIDEEGNYICGSGGIYADKGGLFVIGKDLIIDSTYMFTLSGTIQIAGDIDKTSAGMFHPEHVVLNGASNQSITLLGKDGIGTLELMKERKYCTFTPEKCWNKIVQLEGIRNTPEGFKYYEDGNWADKAYKFVDYDGGKFLVANGFVATHINGLAQDPIYTDDWYFLSCGQAQTQYTGLAMYDNEWFYVEEGKLDIKMSGYVEYNGGLFYVGAGRYLSNVSGLAQDPNTGAWYFLANGQAQTQYTGLTEYDDKWFYVQKGILAEDYTGKVKYDGQYFNVVNGMVK